MAELFRETGVESENQARRSVPEGPRHAKNTSGAAAIPNLRDGEAVAARPSAAASPATRQSKSDGAAEPVKQE
jgi:hypothetical protein